MDREAGASSKAEFHPRLSVARDEFVPAEWRRNPNCWLTDPGGPFGKNGLWPATRPSPEAGGQACTRGRRQNPVPEGGSPIRREARLRVRGGTQGARRDSGCEAQLRREARL